MKIGFEGPQPGVGVDGPGVDDRAAGQHNCHRLKGPVGVVRGTAVHPRRVVSDHPADGARRFARRVGPELRPIPGQPGIERPHGNARLDAHPGAAVEHLDFTEVSAHVHQYAVGDRLPAEARAASTESQRDALRCAGLEQAAHLSGIRRHHHRLRDEQEMRGVVGVGVQVDGAGFDLFRVSDCRAQGVDHLHPRPGAQCFAS